MSLDAVLFRFILALMAAPLLAAPLAACGEVRRGGIGSTAFHAISAVGGLTMLQFVFPAGWGHAVGQALAVYVVISLCTRVRALAAWAHVFAALGALGYLTARHALRGLVTADSVDDLAVQMVLTVKLYTLAYNIADGAGAGAAAVSAGEKRAASDAAAAHAAGDSRAARAAASAAKLYRERRERAVPAVPSLLAFSGYAFNFATVLVGPAFEYSEYERVAARGGSPPPGAPPRMAAVAWALARGFACMGAQVLISPLLPISAIHAHAVAGDRPVWWQLAYAHASLMVLRAGYYAVWLIAEAGAVAVGYGHVHSASGPLASWAGASSVNIAAVEWPTGIASEMKHWNLHTQSWLARYIFLRAPRAHGLNKWLTFLASAFWHGLFPGYYLAFATVPLIMEASARLHARIDPALAVVKASPVLAPLYAVLRVALTFLSLNYCAAVFALYEWDKSYAVWRAWGFYGHTISLVILAAAAVADAICGRPRAAAASRKAKGKAA